MLSKNKRSIFHLNQWKRTNSELSVLEGRLEFRALTYQKKKKLEFRALMQNTITANF